MPTPKVNIDLRGRLTPEIRAAAEAMLEAHRDAADRQVAAIVANIESHIARNAATPRDSAASGVRVFHRIPDPPMGDVRSPRGAFLDEYMAIRPQAIEQAFFSFFFDDEERKPYEMNGSVAIVSIDGPLMQKGGWWYDGYEAISSRFSKALADKAVTAVVLKINSPGGVCSGCFSATREMRAKKAAAGKPVLAYANESAFSAAYSMACIADEIYLPKEGGVGSVGVIGCLFDRTAANEKDGYRVAVITSGEYKADGHPDVPLTKAVVDRYQKRINSLAQSFADVVGEARGMAPSSVLKLEAACLYGDEAVSAGLANGVATFEATIAKAQEMGITRAAKARNLTGALGASTTGDDMSTQTFMAIALALAISPEASEKDIVTEIGAREAKHKATESGLRDELSKANAQTSRLLDVLGAKNVDEGVASLIASTTSSSELVKSIFGCDKSADGKPFTVQDALVKLAADRKAAEANEAEALIEKAKSEGKTADEKARGIFAKFGLDGLKAHLDALVPHAALATKPPPQKSEEKGAASPAPKTGDDEVALTPDDEAFCERYSMDKVAFLATKKRQAAEAKKDAEYRDS